jgi:phosphoribosylanthranilate isomerase
MFRVKICGVTNATDVALAIDAGADALGLNFFEGSTRYLTAEVAARLVTEARRCHETPIEKLPWARPTNLLASLETASRLGKRAKSLQLVGVFVNRNADEIASICQDTKLSSVQLHGDESPADVAAFERVGSQWSLIRARRFDDRGVAAIADDLDACKKAGRPPDAVLVDAMTPGRYGGTGETVSWVGLADHKRWLGDTPLVLAGGLTPDNVAEAIRIVRPAAVDVASGVESSPGKKDPVKVRAFVANALGAFEALSGT